MGFKVEDELQPDPSKQAQEAASFTQNVKKFVYSQLVES